MGSVARAAGDVVRRIGDGAIVSAEGRCALRAGLATALLAGRGKAGRAPAWRLGAIGGRCLGRLAGKGVRSGRGSRGGEARGFGSTLRFGGLATGRVRDAGAAAGRGAGAGCRADGLCSVTTRASRAGRGAACFGRVVAARSTRTGCGLRMGSGTGSRGLRRATGCRCSARRCALRAAVATSRRACASCGWRGRDMAGRATRQLQAPKVTLVGVTVASTVTMRGMMRAGAGTGFSVVRSRLEPSAEKS